MNRDLRTPTTNKGKIMLKKIGYKKEPAMKTGYIVKVGRRRIKTRTHSANWSWKFHYFHRKADSVKYARGIKTVGTIVEIFRARHDFIQAFEVAK